ncbi:forkhead box protein k1 [Biomphalaria glabrata]|nr:putative serine/threonine-protein kinase kinX [Biomphalaria glabrata]
MCRTNGKSSSVIEDRQEDRYSISTSQTVAHELAHGIIKGKVVVEKENFVGINTPTFTKSAKSTSSTSDDHGQVGEQQETHQAASPNVDISSESSLSDNPLDCNIFLNLACFNNFLASYLLICPKCFNYSLNLFLNESARIGFCQELIVKCTSADCSFEESFRSSKENRDGQKRGFREINLRMVSFVRSIGPGHSALLNFCQHTNSPPPISETSYQSVMHTIGLASKKVAEESMEKAAREVKEKVGISNEEGITDCGVSVDGTWQRRGHSSHHGVVTAISIETASQHVTTEKTISATLQRDTLWVLLMRKKSLGQSIIHGCSLPAVSVTLPAF